MDCWSQALGFIQEALLLPRVKNRGFAGDISTAKHCKLYLSFCLSARLSLLCERAL